ncbi:DUF4159 domain-containing protein [Rosistilla oblonga]|uniref:DUF4159 domain-containing protein n=1 Tax=Rosistilla oblonga TaxID=2527990 RepID=UPI003A97A2A5
MNRKPMIIAGLLLAIAVTSLAMAQRWRRDRNRDWQSAGRGDVPDWETNADFPNDMFTFVRIKYQSAGWGRGGGWDTDYRDSDLNFSLRLHQLTSLNVNPEPIVLELTDPRLFDYPWIYIIEPGRLMFTQPEVVALRRYLDNGGFLMIDDFWGDEEWQNLYYQMKRVFPDREPEDVPLSHEIFQCVYPLKIKPQVPSIGAWGGRGSRTWERGPDTQTPNYRSITDDAGRIMVFICHNTDLGDGWEREAESPDYFEEMSVKYAYPLGINIVTYAMTH